MRGVEANGDKHHVPILTDDLRLKTVPRWAWWARDVILGRIALPDRASMAPDIATGVMRQDPGESGDDANWYQGDYVKELIEDTDCPTFDVKGACQAFKEWTGYKKKGVMTFRDNSFRSVITGTMAPVHHTPCKDALDDSLAVNLRNQPQSNFARRDSGH